MAIVDEGQRKTFYDLLGKLPALRKILQYLSIKDRKRLRVVCKDLLNLVSDLDESFSFWTINFSGCSPITRYKGYGNYETIPDFVRTSSKPIVLNLDIHPYPHREYYKRDKEQNYQLSEETYVDMFGAMYKIGRMHDRVIGISVIESALPFVEDNISGDMTSLQIIKITGNISGNSILNFADN